jgi:hypothetical protein
MRPVAIVAEKETMGMENNTFFSRTATTAVGALLLLVIIWAAWMLGPTAIDRWFR